MKLNIRNILAVIIMVGSFVILGLMVFKPIPETNKDIFNTCVGVVLGASITGVVGYYYSDSKKENTLEIYDATKKTIE